MIHWQDIISLNEISVHGFPEQTKDIQKFFNKIQSTPEGQQLFQDIQNKYGSKKLPIDFDNTFQSKHLDGFIHFNLQDFHALQAVNTHTEKYEPVGLPYIVYHELCHAADPRLPLPKPVEGHVSPEDVLISRMTAPKPPYQMRGPDGVTTPAEITATNRTYAFMHKYFPELPNWSEYNTTRSVGKIDNDFTIINASENPKISNQDLIKICMETQKFDYGEVTASDANYCQSLPQSRNTKGKKPPVLP